MLASRIGQLSYGALVGALSGIGLNDLIHSSIVPFISQQQGAVVSTDWVGYGVGGAIAILVIQWKRADDAEHAKKIGTYADALAAVNLRLENIQDNSSRVIQANTAAFISMEGALKSYNQYDQIIQRIGAIETSRREAGEGSDKGGDK